MAAPLASPLVKPTRGTWPLLSQGPVTVWVCVQVERERSGRPSSLSHASWERSAGLARGDGTRSISSLNGEIRMCRLTHSMSGSVAVIQRVAKVSRRASSMAPGLAALRPSGRCSLTPRQAWRRRCSHRSLLDAATTVRVCAPFFFV